MRDLNPKLTTSAIGDDENQDVDENDNEANLLEGTTREVGW